MVKTVSRVIALYTVLRGITEFTDDVSSVARWITMDNFHSDVWWGVLLLLGFVLLVSTFIPYRSWVRWYRSYTPLLVRRLIDQIIPIRPSGNKITAFYASRKTMTDLYGGIAREMNDSETIWAAWPGATTAQDQPEENRRKVKLLLLQEPAKGESSKYGEIVGLKESDIESDVQIATREFAKVGTEVRWYEGPLASITLGDPCKHNAWARVEVRLPIDNARWQSYLIYKRDNEEAYKAVLDSFLYMWNHQKWTREAPLYK